MTHQICALSVPLPQFNSFPFSRPRFNITNYTKFQHQFIWHQYDKSHISKNTIFRKI